MADIKQVKVGNTTYDLSVKPEKIMDGYTSSAFYLNTHPENSPTIIPFINNDIAFLLKRGGSAVVKYDGTVQNVDINAVFDGSGSYWAINPTGVTEITIELTLHKVFAWSNNIYFDSGSNGWRAKHFKIEVINTNYADDVWTKKAELNDYGRSQYKTLVNHTPVGATNAGGGFNKLRFTFSNWNSATIFRIACLGIINYGSSGIREIAIPKDGGEIYGNIYPRTNNTNSIGTSSNKFANLYATNLNGVAIGSSPKFTDTTYSSKAAASGGTDVSLVTTGEKYTWNSKTSNTGTVTSVAVKMNGSTKGTVTTSGTIDLGTVITDISGKQDKLTAQTAYSSKGSATKVPQITTNSLGQVTGITEVTITQPTVNNGTLTIQKNGTQVATFTANQSGNSTANITVPTISYATTTMSASSWTANKTYSFESSYPFASKDLDLSISPSATDEQKEAYAAAMITGSPTSNVVTALGDVPSIDIPVFLKVVTK